MGAAACSTPPERLVVEDFFGASRLRDRTALASISTVVFEPLDQGIVTDFQIVSTGESERRPLGQQSAAARIADLSLANVRRSQQAGDQGMDIVSKQLNLSAPVKLPSGETASRKLTLILQRAVVKANPEIVGRWIVTGVTVY